MVFGTSLELESELMREYVERLQAMTDIQLAKEWSDVWAKHRTDGRVVGSNQGDKLDALRDVIVDRFVKRAYSASDSDK